MEFDINSNSVPYDPSLHCHCVSSLKEYGSYYKITVSKMVNDLERAPLTDHEKMLISIAKEHGISRSEILFIDWCSRHGCLDTYFPDLLPRKLLDDDDPFDPYDYFDNFKPKIDHVGRYINNIMRARKTLDELGNCNEWDYFVTLTISPDKFDRYDLKEFYNKFANFKRNYKQNFGIRFGHVFVPEQHSDGAWHLHGLINNLGTDQLVEYRLQDYFPYTDVRLPNYIRERVAKGEKLYYWKPYSDKFGYSVVEPLRSSERASNYITKYIGKGFIGNDQFKNARLIIPSLGLKRAVKLKKGFTYIDDVKPSFDCDYATTFKFPKSEYSINDLLKYFSDYDSIGQ